MDRDVIIQGHCGEYSPTFTITLKNKELWKQFEALDTEMIITKSGRRIFPSIDVNISRLDPHTQYKICLEMVPVTHCRYKYSSSAGWLPAGTEDVQNNRRIYNHPDSPATGAYWMSQPVSFSRVKLTNKLTAKDGQVILSSMHRYQPRIIISRIENNWEPYTSVVFPETKFIAVTAYQNDRVTELKIDHNPFAKGFRHNGQSKSKRKLKMVDIQKAKTKTRRLQDETTISKSKTDDDTISVSSSTSGSSSSENCHQCRKPSSIIGPESAQNDTLSYRYKPILPQYTSSMSLHPYYYPRYSMYPQIWEVPAPVYFHHSLYSSRHHPVAQDLSTQQPNSNEVRKLTDFSIRAITGCS